MMRLSRVLLPAVLTLLSTQIAYSQQVKESTTVEVVQVPVYVTSYGASVRGLTRDDFTLRINGRKQEIDYFDVVDFKSLSEEQMRDPRQRRLYVLTFDLANMAPFAMLRARRAAEEYLTAAQSSDYFAIALLNRYNEFEFIVPFTRDQVALRRAVASFSTSSTGDPLHLTVSSGDRIGLINDDASTIQDLRRMGESQTAAFVADIGRRRVDDQFETLGEVARRLAPLEGYKHIVLLSRGFDSYLMMNGATGLTGSILEGPRSGTMQQVTALPTSSFNGTSSPNYTRVREFNGFDSRLLESHLRMQKKFSSAGVFLDAIDIEGLRPAGRGSSNESLHFLVADTGELVEHRNDLKAAMQRLTDSQQVVYVLGFHAANTGRKQNSISVDVAGAPRGSYVNYRESYSSIADKPSSTDALRLADIVTNDIPQNGISMAAEVTPASKRATVKIALPGQELLAIADGDAVVKGDALLYVFAGQTAVAFEKKAINVDVNQARTSGLDGSNVELSQSFDLPPGGYALKVLVRLVRADGRDTLAFARKDFTVGE